MVSVELTSKEIGLICYLAGLSTGKLTKTESGEKVFRNEVVPLLEKLARAQAGVKKTEV